MATYASRVFFSREQARTPAPTWLSCEFDGALHLFTCLSAERQQGSAFDSDGGPAKSARRPKGKAHVGTSWHPT